jgi:hypothetical protein
MAPARVPLLMAVLGGAARARAARASEEHFVTFDVSSGSSRFLASGDRLICGVKSQFWGLATCAPQNVTLLLDTSPALICAPEGLAGKVLFFPHEFWDAVQSSDAEARAAARASYSCVDWASGRFDPAKVSGSTAWGPSSPAEVSGSSQLALLRLLVSLNATGVMWDKFVSKSRGGFLSTDDMYEPRDGVGLPTLRLECAVPWTVAGRAFFATENASSTELELVCEELPFAVMFQSWAYFAVFRVGFGVLFTALAMHGLRLLWYTRRGGERSFILLVNIGSSGVLGVWLFFIGGFYSLPTLKSQQRDSLLVSFVGEVLSSIMLVTIRWASVLDTLSGVVKSYGAYYGLVAATFVASLVFTVCILTEKVKITEVQFEASVSYLVWTFSAALFYLWTARSYYSRLDWLMAESAQDKIETIEQIKSILRDVVRTGLVLAATCVSMALLGTDAVFAPDGWALIWGFHWACRWALSLSAMQLATRDAKRVACKSKLRVQARPVTSNSQTALTRVLPASPSATRTFTSHSHSLSPQLASRISS